MKNRLIGIVEDYWRSRVPLLVKSIEEARERLDNILLLEQYHRTGHKEAAKLGGSLGHFGAAAFNISSLSNLLQQRPQGAGLGKERQQRIEGLSEELGGLLAGYGRQAPACGFVELSKGAGAALKGFDAHIEKMAPTFRLLRTAGLEAEGRYDPVHHAASLKELDWRGLSEEEMALCPPFVVMGLPGPDSGSTLPELVELATSGRPLKIALFRRGFADDLVMGESGGAGRGALDATLLFLSLRDAYFLQCSPAAGIGAEEMLRRGLKATRPAVFSLFPAGGGKNGAAGRAAGALQSRAFPTLAYDPDRAADIASRLDLSANPEPGQAWPTLPLEYLEGGEKRTLERPYTFADFAAGEADLKDEFKPLPEGGAAPEAVPITDYLGMSPAERGGKTPFVTTVDNRKRLVRMVPSLAVVAFTADRMSQWRILQELGGIDNPFARTAREKVESELAGELEESKREINGRMEELAGERERGAVSAAMRNFAGWLVGIEIPAGAAPGTAAGGSPAAAAGSTPAGAGAEAEEAAAPISETP